MNHSRWDQQVRDTIINESLTMGSAGARYNLAECTIKAWVGKYQEGGEEALLENGRGRPPMGRKKKPRLEDYEPGSMEYLKLKVELLERENLLLKKHI